jgi:uncharacterized phage protein (TIGR02218 family)
MPRVISTALQNHLLSGTTTLCWCYKLARADGVLMGFTDHDNNLVFEGVTYEAMSGFTGTEVHENIGLSTDNQDITGALTSARITETDILNGLYDSATLTLYRVNWNNVSERVLLKVGTVGEVTRSDQMFKAEFRGLSHYLQQPQGRIYQYGCDVSLGSTRCGVNLNLYTHAGSVASLVDRSVFTCLGPMTALAGDYLSRGKLTWTSGMNVNKSIEIKYHYNSVGVISLEIWQPTINPIVSGDTFISVAGCDKQPATCKNRFANFVNFQGFPYIPGPDIIQEIGKQSETGNDGGSRGLLFSV